LVDDPHLICSMKQLEALFGEVNPLAIAKELTALNETYARWIAASPFAVLATIGSGGLDCSPRGDPPGQLVHFLDDQTLVFPHRRGNNRNDTLRNLVENPALAVLFMIPGVGDCLRVNGEATITTDPELLAGFEMNGKRPVCAIRMRVAAVYFQCKKAVHRAGLWQADQPQNDNSIPTAGDMLRAAVEADFDGQAYDAAYPARMKETLY
jgi:PPOX class probable FMN-dependent enzyme